MLSEGCNPGKVPLLYPDPPPLLCRCCCLLVSQSLYWSISHACPTITGSLCLSCPTLTSPSLLCSPVELFCLRLHIQSHPSIQPRPHPNQFSPPPPPLVSSEPVYRTSLSQYNGVAGGLDVGPMDAEALLLVFELQRISVQRDALNWCRRIRFTGNELSGLIDHQWECRLIRASSARLIRTSSGANVFIR